MSSRIWLLQFCLLQFYVSLLHAIPPPPVQCYGNGCTVDNYQGLWMDHIPCKAANVVYPTTEEELVKAMAEAVKCKQKMKVVSKWSHTLSKFVCPGGDDGLLISTRDYSTAMSVNQSAMTITANAGVQLRTLIDYAADFGLALPYTTYWDGVSVTGVVSTGAHGSGLWNKGSALHEYITAMRLAVPSTEEEGYVRIVSLTDVDEDLDAARVSLGVLGVILQVTFALHPMFKRSVSLEARADNLLEEDVLSFAQAHDFGDITWYPSIRKALYRLDDLVSVDSPGDGINKYQGFQGIPVAQIEQARRGGNLCFFCGFRSLLFLRYSLTSLAATEEFLEKTRNAATACKISEMLLNKRVSDGNGFLNDGSSFTGFPVVGFNHLMQASGGCQDSYSTKQHILTPTGVQSQSSCASQKDGIDEVLPDSAFCYWDPRINSSIFYQTAIAVSLSNISELILDIKKIRDIDPNGLCGLGLYGGIMLRYMKKSRAFLGINEDVVDIDFTYFRSRDANSPRLNGDVMERN
ncbi:hypothetical protein O6H91_10G023000 [Diphasiastrum complanatum]|uniref:Uncharacterized protein n=1 Tax=Diphasiastrum complanatum TaxID=34168 RepID=A0ACC2CF36_DIPCM|nr:hypothetical protein O6H91_10G023000 [Diphasiastrum complanatum]